MYIDSLRQATRFAELDASSGHRKMEVNQTETDEASFVTRNRMYKYNRVPFELENAPLTFQRAMDVKLATVKLPHTLVYIDDIIIFSPTPGNYIMHDESILCLSVTHA